MTPVTPEFIENLGRVPGNMHRAIRGMAKTPTERNECYLVGFSEGCRLGGIINDDTHSFLLSLSGELRRSEETRNYILEAL